MALTSHVRRYHKHYASSGHVWQGRLKVLVQRGEHLLMVLRYVLQNPVRSGLAASMIGVGQVAVGTSWPDPCPVAAGDFRTRRQDGAPLGRETDKAFALLSSLNEAQRKQGWR